jgi:hypothetical protein
MASAHSFFPNLRFFVPDLSPIDRVELQKVAPKTVFVAESPHISELEPDSESERRPLCGKAGKQWWSLLGEFIEDDPGEEVDLQRMLRLCQAVPIAVINAIQFPLDPKVARVFPKADPVKNLGFSKEPGPFSFKKLKEGEGVRSCISALRGRLLNPYLLGAQVICLGNDAQWFVEAALGEQASKRMGVKIPHPSAWWRRGGLYGRMARERAIEIFD